MTTSIDRDEGTSNSDRIASEVEQAALEVTERFPGYRRRLAQAAMECYILTAEHDEQRISINQKYDEVIRALAREIGQNAPSRGEG